MIKHEFTITVALFILTGLLLVVIMAAVYFGANEILTDWLVYGLLTNMFVLGIFKGVMLFVKIERNDKRTRKST